MAKRKPDAIQRFVKQVEKNATKLKKDLQRFSKDADIPHRLEEIAGELRRGAAAVAAEVEHYLHDLRAPKKPAAAARKRRTARKKTARKSSAKRTVKKRARKSAKKRARKS